MRISNLLIATALVAGIAVPALAQPPAPPTPEEQAAAFKAADKNGDGKLDLTEFKALMTARMGDRAASITDDQWKMRFDARDADKDGFISPTEMAAPGGRRGGGGGGGQ